MKNEKEKRCEVLLEGLDENNITSILNKWNEVVTVRKELDELEDMLKTKIKVFLKERKWNKYNDKDTKISISLITQKRETPDMLQIKSILNESQLAQVIRITTFEKLLIVTPESRKRLKHYVNRKRI